MPQAGEGSQQKAPDHPSSRRRRQHIRTFTGCTTCRRRHVKCDEAIPLCGNCNRLSLSCDYKQKFFFKVAGQNDFKSRRTNSITERRASPSGDYSISPEVTEITTPESFNIPASSGPLDFDMTTNDVRSEEFQDPHTAAPELFSSILLPDLPVYDLLYYNHFLTTVSSLLIIYDTPSNFNPYRSLPQLAGASGLLYDTMIALGGMHFASLSDTPERQRHSRAAADVYGTVITRARNLISVDAYQSNLELLATSLLLCLYEKMSSADAKWKIHLAGASQIFERIYSPRISTISYEEGPENSAVTFTVPMRRFLVSLLSYLDVAAACATGEGTMIAGDYWEKFGGGWEYNLGVPSFGASCASKDRVLAQIRHAWSQVMTIQADISRFAKLQSASLGIDQREIFRSDLETRIQNWHESAPSIFERVARLNEIPPASPTREVEHLTAAACILAYSTACKIYLRRVAEQQISSTEADEDLATEVEMILKLCLNFSGGINRMALLWPLFTAGTVCVDQEQQDCVRTCLSGMKCFGFKHISRALDTCEYVWLQRRLFGEVNYKEFQNLTRSNLLP